jgi:hypothetical protein
MKKIFLVLALAFAFTTGMAAVTVITHPDQAMAVTVVAPALTPANAVQLFARQKPQGHSQFLLPGASA